MGTTRKAPAENAPSGPDIADGGHGSCFDWLVDADAAALGCARMSGEGEADASYVCAVGGPHSGGVVDALSPCAAGVDRRGGGAGGGGGRGAGGGKTARPRGEPRRRGPRR